MKQIYILLVCISMSTSLMYAQENLSQNVSVTFKKAREVSQGFNLNSTTRLRDERITKIMVKCKVKSLDKKPVDSNGFYLIDTANKLRYRFIEYGGYLPITIIVSNERTDRILKTPLVNKNGKASTYIPKYDPSVYDSFEDYSIDGYTNIEFPINFNTKKNPKTSVTYYTPTPFKKFTATMHFNILVNQKPPQLELYYQHQKIEGFEVEFK